MSPILFREYGNDIPACMLTEHPSWRCGEEEDMMRKRNEKDGEKAHIGFISSSLEKKSDQSKTEDEEWDGILNQTLNSSDLWRTGKQDRT